jgi:hypothetical protein
MEQIKWEVFTEEERVHIFSLVAREEYDAIPKAVMMDTLEKEYWIEKILEDKKPAPPILDSKVEKELEKVAKIESPEEEAEWQKKLDEEKQAHVEKVKGVVTEEKKLVWCEQCGSKGVKHKKGCPTLEK